MITPTPEQSKKRTRRSNEGIIQSECFTWFWNEYPQFRGCLFHCPNENDRSDSNPIQGAIRKSLGVVSGVSDFIFLVQRRGYGALCIEMKDENGQQRPTQRDWQKTVEAQGYKYCLCRSLAQFQNIMRWYLDN